MEVLSKQMFLELYSYLSQVAATQFFFTKGRPDMVLEIVNVSIYNPSDTNFARVYILVKRKGVIHRINYDAVHVTVTVVRYPNEIYLAPGDELGIEFDCAAANKEIRVSVMGIMWSDKEILTARGAI